MREGTGPAPVQSPLVMYASLLSPGAKLEKRMEGKKGYVHVVQRSGYNTGPATGASVKLGSGNAGLMIREGDGAYIFVGGAGNALEVQNVGDTVAEVVLFDIEA